MFYMSLQVVGPPEPCLCDFVERYYDDELDNLISLFTDICRRFHATHHMLFHVEGFGQSNWPVDVATDLNIIIEQMADLLEWLDADQANAFSLDFFEQGVERYLALKQEANLIHIRCKSLTNWQPSPIDEYCERHVFDRMCSDIVRTFVLQAKQICPAISSHPWFQAWCHKNVVQKRLG